MLKEQMDNDLGHMLNPEDFGDKVIYKPGEVDELIVNGIFDNDSIDVDLGDGALITDQKPTVGVRESDFSVFPEIGEHIQVKGNLYQIEDIRDDSTGFLFLILNEV